jgi:hypothetical protein
VDAALGSHREGRKDGYSKLMLSAPLIGIIAVRDRYDREHCLRAGRIWQRAHLLATARGVAGRPCNEAVEMIDHEKAHGKPPLRAGLLGRCPGRRRVAADLCFLYGLSDLDRPCQPAAAD